MEITDWAKIILGGLSLEEKLFCPKVLTDDEKKLPFFWETPSRPEHLKFRVLSKEKKLPPFHEHGDAYKRALCLHRFAGHELLAVELMAYALLAFPELPKHFRKGLAHTLKEEQEHVRLYIRHLQTMGMSFGDEPLSGRFWKLTPYLKTPSQYLSAVHLTLEMANLDFAPHYGLSFERHGDKSSANIMKQIFDDELSHVSFGYHWLCRLKQDHLQSWEAYLAALPPILPVSRAKGFIFNKDSRKKIKLPSQWIELIEKS